MVLARAMVLARVMVLALVMVLARVRAKRRPKGPRLLVFDIFILKKHKKEVNCAMYFWANTISQVLSTHKCDTCDHAYFNDLTLKKHKKAVNCTIYFCGNTICQVLSTHVFPNGLKNLMRFQGS